jgi:hypothetical protein
MLDGRVFLLSPAFCGGRRAQILISDRARFPLAEALARGEAPLGSVFAFMSGLYFRGKLAYAESFAQRGDAHVITPTRGLQPPDLPVTIPLIREFAAVDVDAADRRYREPLDRDAVALASRLHPAAQVILLGSIATGKYVDVLLDVFGPRLCFPLDFVGRGDMSRGALMLRAAREGRELEYAPVAVTRRHGPRARRIAEMP